MNSKLQAQFNNLEAMIRVKWDSNKLTYDNFLDNEIIQIIITKTWEQYFKEAFSEQEFEQRIKEPFENVQPTEAVAFDYRLPDWLDQAKRTSLHGEIWFNIYKTELSKRGRGDSVNQIDADTFYILNKCNDPRDTSKVWDRRGLVYGNVQSGKTANYIGLINRAFDYGYKIVIVLTGITEDLRQQTQKRVDQFVLLGDRDVYRATTVNDDLSKQFNMGN